MGKRMAFQKMRWVLVVIYEMQIDVTRLSVKHYSLMISFDFLWRQGQTVATLKTCILENAYVIPDSLSQPLADLIRSLLRTNPNERLTVTEIMVHPWLTGQVFQKALADNFFVPTVDKNQVC